MGQTISWGNIYLKLTLLYCPLPGRKTNFHQPNLIHTHNIIIIIIIIIIKALMRDSEKGEDFTFSHFPPPPEFRQPDGETKSLLLHSAFPLGTAP
jgi:hypothetical protein